MQVVSVFLENDVVDGKDKHYTNGSSFMYLRIKIQITYQNMIIVFFGWISKIPTFNNNTTNQTLGLNYSQLAFTPSDLEAKK